MSAAMYLQLLPASKKVPFRSTQSLKQKETGALYYNKATPVYLVKKLLSPDSTTFFSVIYADLSASSICLAGILVYSVIICSAILTIFSEPIKIEDL
jgi:hypothetical protein